MKSESKCVCYGGLSARRQQWPELKPSLQTDEQASRNQTLQAPSAVVSVSCSLSLGKLLRILSFSFTKHHRTVLKNNNENKALHTISHGTSTENNARACLRHQSGWRRPGTVVWCHLYRRQLGKRSHSWHSFHLGLFCPLSSILNYTVAVGQPHLSISLAQFALVGCG